MKYYSTGNIPKEDSGIVYFNKKGDKLNDKDIHKQQYYAAQKENTFTRRIRSEDQTRFEEFKTTETQYFVRTHQNVPLDPLGPYSKRERNLDTKMTRVSKNTFDFYVTYLKTNNSIYLTKATRGVMND